MALSAGPNSPSSEDKKGNRANLDQAPPLPPTLRTPDNSQLAGTMSQTQQGAPPTGDIASAVAQQAMLVEKIIGQLAQMLPSFAPSASQIVATLRAGVVGALQQQQQGQQGPGVGALGSGVPGAGAAPMAG
jgi:hypothetical protein